MRFEKLGFIRLNDVVLAALQFDMSSGESIERSTRTDEFTGETRNSQYHNVSEDCLRSGCGTSECGESFGDTIFLRDSKRAPSEKTLRNKSERVPESELVSLVTTYFSRQAVTYRRLIREIEHIEGLCLLFAHLRLQCGSTGSEEKEKM